MPAAQAFDQETLGHDNGTQALLKMIGKLYHVLSAQNTELAQASLRLEERVAQRTRERWPAPTTICNRPTRLEAFSPTGCCKLPTVRISSDRLAQACAAAVQPANAAGPVDDRRGLFQALQRQLWPPGR